MAKAARNNEEVNDVVGNDNVQENAAKYLVNDGKSFTDISFPKKEWNGGDDVSHLPQDRLDSLVAQGLIQKH
jgi:hypothetical protein